MKDRIVEAYLNEFRDAHGLHNISEGRAFEHYINHSVVSREHLDPFSFEDVAVGGGGDLGIDGIAFLVNDHLVKTAEDVDYFKSELRRLDVKFIFIQSRISGVFSRDHIGSFISGVRSFFDQEAPTANQEIQALQEIKEYIYDNAMDMDEAPECILIYATPGDWQQPDNIMIRVEQGIDDIKNTKLFSEVQFVPLDSQGIRDLHRELNRKVTKTISFDKHTIMPSIHGVKEAYIGIVPCLNYIALISRDDRTIDRRLFHDNVRDFQGHNSVNREIKETIESEEERGRFPLLNNGVTIVAKDVKKIGAEFGLVDFQVVNGCQTSHVLLQNRNHLSQDDYIPLKLIVTGDMDVTNQIIKATNRQTEVKLEAFESLSPFHKKLEEYYEAMRKGDGAPQLYYERRSKQYEHLVEDEDMGRDQIVTLASQVLCFVAMFLNEPHSTKRYYGEVLDAYRNRIFLDGHSCFPYYLSGLTLYVIHRALRTGQIPTEHRCLRYQYLLLVRLLGQDDELPYLNSNQIERYCKKLLGMLYDEEASTRVIDKSRSIIEKALERNEIEPLIAKTRKYFTNQLIKAAGHEELVVGEVQRYEGTVKLFSDVKGYGFIESPSYPEDIFVHYSGIRGFGYRSLKKGQTVTFYVVEEAKGPSARDVAVTV